MTLQHLQDCKLLYTHPSSLSSPVVIDEETFCVSENGDVLKLGKNGQVQVVFTILGHPSCLAWRDEGDMFLIADFAHQSIFAREESSGQQITNLIAEYNHHAFLGPNSIKLGPFTKSLYFTDSGPFMESSIENKTGSLFVYKFDGINTAGKLKCLAERSLAFPAGIQIDQQQKFVLVCEMGENRILKFIIDESGAANSTVFHQFSGRFGPSCISHFQSLFYVSLFEFAPLASIGLIAVLSNQGEVVQRFTIPIGPQISGLHLYADSENTYEEAILVTEGNKIYRVSMKRQDEEKLEQSIVVPKN